MNSLTRTLLALSALATISRWNGGASASILGDTLALSYDYPTRTTPASGVLIFGSPFTLTNGGSQSSMLIGRNSISMGYSPGTSFESVAFGFALNETFKKAQRSVARS